MRDKHRLLELILPAKAFAALKTGTKEWLAECSCGHKSDLWDSGGIRYKAMGEPKRLRHCLACRSSTMHKIRKKTQEEKIEML